MIAAQFLKRFNGDKISGCFTLEYFLRGKTLAEIWTELGLQHDTLNGGAVIVWAPEPPAISNFWLAGWAEYPTNKFIKYKLETKQWSRELYEKTYKGKRIPISIEEAKKAWLWDLKAHKLVKVVPLIRESDMEYPSGGQAGQIVIIDPIPCQVSCFLKPNEVFTGIFN